ncbi:Lrp/AsnC family transcriptional regulator [Phascolarctobacterium sp.]
MDEIDFQIIDLLKKNSRTTASTISSLVNLTVPAVIERMKKLEKSMVIKEYTIKTDQKKLGYALTAFILVVLKQSADVNGFRNKIIREPNVLECHHVAGQYDYILKLCVKDTDDLEFFLMNVLKKIDGVASSNTLISLSVLKENINI